ncbi:MAG TPA: metallophosphoesterase [Burkholderiaceae bacterium]|nr:metallophosphoesterase [Burkholderiaceae bacterium]
MTPPAARTPPDTVIYAVGDVHGRADLLDALIARIAADAAGRRARKRVIVMLGDYVSRGSSSRRVIEALLAPPPAGFDRITLRGNHEDYWLHYLDGDLDFGRRWFNWGGLAVLADYGVDIGARDWHDDATLADVRTRLAAAIPAAHRAFVSATRTSWRSGDYLFVHAGVRPGVPLEQQDAHDLMWIRQPFLDSTADHGAVVVHGHCIADAPVLRANRIGIDTGAFRSGVLTCVALEGEQRDILQT